MALRLDEVSLEDSVAETLGSERNERGNVLVTSWRHAGTEGLLLVNERHCIPWRTASTTWNVLGPIRESLVACG